MAASPKQNSDEWEYEYDHNASEVFLVDLDLTTLHRTFKSTATDRGRRIIDLPDKRRVKKPKLSKLDGPASGTGNVHEPQSPTLAVDPTPENEESKQHSLSFLDLHTANPVVSYKGEVFTCTWTDMIGTNMFFSQPKETPLYDPDISTRDFDLVGTSRIKLVGVPAKISPIPQTATEPVTKGKTQHKPPSLEEPAGKSLGSIRRSHPKVNADIRKQANFLEQLMNIKKNRGEHDNVHVVMNEKISHNFAAGKLKFNSQKQNNEIDKLNRRIVRGDGAAFQKLEHIYSGQEDDSDDDLPLANGSETIAAGPIPLSNQAQTPGNESEMSRV